MPYDIHIRKNATGEIRVYHDDSAWEDHTLFFWTDGNFGCDCNRDLVWRWAAGENTDDQPSPDFPCGDDAYTVIKAVLPDGTEVKIDSDEASEKYSPAPLP